MSTMATAGTYLRAAVSHPWNLLMLSAGAVASLITSSEVPLMMAAGLELAYLGIIPANERFRKAIDARLHREKRKHESRRSEGMLDELAGNQREHYLSLRQLAERIKANYRKHEDTHGSLLMEQSQTKIDTLLNAFLKLLVTLNDYRRYLNATDRRMIERDLHELEADLASGGGSSEAVREIKKKRIEILKKRLERFTKAEESREVISHQLASIEDMLRLVHEQSITIRDPAAITQQLDALTLEVEETENTVREMERFLELTAEAQALPAPPQQVKVR